MKKLIATLLVPALSLGLASCNRSEEDRNRITLALSTQTNPFFVELRHGAQDKAKELGVPLDIQDASDDPAQQVNQLGNATSMGAKVVVVNPPILMPSPRPCAASRMTACRLSAWTATSTA